MSRFALFLFIACLFCDAPCGLSQTADAQSSSQESSRKDAADVKENLLLNGGMEQIDADKAPPWVFPSMLSGAGYKMQVDDEQPFEGKTCIQIDARDAEAAKSPFGLFNQYLSAENYQGKRIRFRAAVRTDGAANGRAQLWLRVDRKSEGGIPKMGAFDNMGDRPIQESEWKHYDIVVDVEEDAERLTVGMLVFGKTVAWIDDASLTIVDDDQATTAMQMAAATTNSPKQPFYTHWLWLAVLVIALLCCSQLPDSRFQRFAMFFATTYWVLYSFPTLLQGFLGRAVGLLAQLGVELPMFWAAWLEGYQSMKQSVVRWTAGSVLGIEGELVLPNGSGDTTFDFVRLFDCFFLALLAAGILLLLFRKKQTQPWLRDIHRSYLRYVLAATMLSYGLAKAGFITTQFSMGDGPSEFQLSRTYGESSPMGLLWTFMAASPAFTFLSGLAEVVGGTLLVFRRTATLGGIVTFAVMFQVMLLNFCYDVPVKQYSFHLALMAVIIMLPESKRLLNLLLLNRPTEPSQLLQPSYAKDNTKVLWAHRVSKSLIVLIMFAIPIGIHMYREFSHEHAASEESEHLLMNRGFRWISEYPFNR